MQLKCGDVVNGEEMLLIFCWTRDGQPFSRRCWGRHSFFLLNAPIFAHKSRLRVRFLERSKEGIILIGYCYTVILDASTNALSNVALEIASPQITTSSH